MSEVQGGQAAASEGTLSAGAMLRRARQAQGLHIVALAAAIKVAPQKLELLENDRHDELLDATFARALAQAVCRALKIDPQPVLAQLPGASSHGLDRVAASINTPFREYEGQGESSAWALLERPAVWGPLLLLVAAGALLLLPKSLLPTNLWPGGAAVTSSPASAPAPTGAASEVVVETVFSSPTEAASAPAAGAAAEAAPAAVPAGILTLRTTGESWIEVLDARGQPLLSRLLLQGETVGLDGATPLRLTIGNAAVTQVSFRGKQVPLPAPSRDNVVRLELK